MGIRRDCLESGGSQPPGGAHVVGTQGGRHDGSIVRSDVEHMERFAKYFWKLTWNGTVGRRFDITDSKSTDYERYQVKVKDEHECEIIITCEVVS
jgi:hypothetical protein